MARILVAEDNDSVRDYMKRGLASAGHIVTACPDGGAALTQLRESAYDLLVTDIVMPVMDGIALALAALDVCPDMPIIMMSGYAQERQRAHNLQDLITDILSKPFTLTELRAAVDKILIQGTADVF
jgi:two-component system, cell cycle response regulator CpdR